MINFTKLLGGQPTVSQAVKDVSKRSRQTASKVSSALRPLAVFNITRKCNLDCRHCYLESENRVFKGELTTKEVEKTINSLAKIKVPILLLSGGEPLVRKDIFTIIEYAKKKKLRVGLSSNGTLISKTMAKRLRQSGIDYVGVSIDGNQKQHDTFRGINSAYKKAIRGIINSREAGLKTGIRFTITRFNALSLPDVLELCLREGVERFCMYHLVYSGRGQGLSRLDIDNQRRRKIVDFLVKRALEYNMRKYPLEILTVDNHADGIYIYNFLKKRKTRLANKVLKLLKFHGGCSAASKIVNISPKGEVFACQFWQQDPIGNIRQTDFGRIWQNGNDKLLCQLRRKTDYLKGKCGRCRYKQYCGGCRVRAYTVYNDIWQEDPCCYLTEKEIK